MMNANRAKLLFTTDINLHETFLRGYLYVPSSNTLDNDTYKNKFGKYVTYGVMVRALELIGKFVDQNIYTLGDCSCFDSDCECEGKSTFNLLGTYKGEPFVIYDWKQDGMIHIGGSGSLKLDELLVLLEEAILVAIKKLQ